MLPLLKVMNYHTSYMYKVLTLYSQRSRWVVQRHHFAIATSLLYMCNAHPRDVKYPQLAALSTVSGMFTKIRIPLWTKLAGSHWCPDLIASPPRVTGSLRDSWFDRYFKGILFNWKSNWKCTQRTLGWQRWPRGKASAVFCGYNCIWRPINWCYNWTRLTFVPQ